MNGARSRDPVTAVGKARSSRNAFWHGLAAAVQLVGSGEEPAPLDPLRAGLVAELAPAIHDAVAAPAGPATTAASPNEPEPAPLLARLGRSAAAPAAGPPDPAAELGAELAEADPEGRAAWDALGYLARVVPPGSGHRPMASLTAERVCAADRWRVPEELSRLDDPAEHARVLGHFARAGLDPGRDHAAFGSDRACAGPGCPSREPRD